MRDTHFFWLVPFALVSVVSGPAAALPNLLTNGSFENITGATVSTTTTSAVGSLPGWTIAANNTGSISYGSGPGLGPELVVTNGTTTLPYGDKISADPYTFGPDAAGQHALYLVDDGAKETISQNISLTAGTTYEVGFDLFQTVSGSSNPGNFTLDATLNGVSLTHSTNLTLPAGVWYHFASTYIPATSGSVSFVFTYTSAGSGTSKDVVVDQVYVETPPTTPGVGPGTGGSPYSAVPEPPALAMLLFAVPVALAARRRRTL